MQRRSFLTGMAAILASGMAPASARSGVLMPIRPAIYVPEVLVFKRHMPFLYEDGIPSEMQRQFALMLEDYRADVVLNLESCMRSVTEMYLADPRRTNPSQWSQRPPATTKPLAPR